MTAARRLTFHRTGKPAEVLEMEDFEAVAGPGEVVVRLLAAPINPADLNFIEGTYGVKAVLPGYPGIEGCGVVEASEAEGFRVGERVSFLRRVASWATHAVVPGVDLFKLPEGIDVRQAAMLKVNPATAWLLLREFGEVEEGSFVVQNAGNSGVGRCVAQLARRAGVRVISFARRRELFDELREAGGEVFMDDAEGHAAARELMAGAEARLAFNAVGGESALRLMKLLAVGGTHVTYGAMARKPLTVPNGLLIFRDIRVRGLWVSRWIDGAEPAAVVRLCDELAGELAAGNLRQAVDSVYPLEEFRAALERLEAGDRNGKVLLGGRVRSDQ